METLNLANKSFTILGLKGSGKTHLARHILDTLPKEASIFTSLLLRE